MFVIPQVGQIVKRAALVTQMLSTALVFIVLITFSIISWQNAEQTLKVQREQATNDKLASIKDSIKQRMELNRTLLRGGSGLFEASDSVNSDEWHRFVQQFRITERFKGISTVGYLSVVTPENRDGFVASVRAEGNPNYTITPEGNRDIYTPILYTEHFQDAKPILGYDPFTNAQRRFAMEKARDEGRAVLTDSLHLGTGTSSRVGVIMYIPIYSQSSNPQTVQDRRDNLVGFVYEGIETKVLLSDLISTRDKNVGLMVTDQDSRDTKLLYSSLATSEKTPQNNVANSNLDVFGQVWKISLYARDGLVPMADNSRPATILAGGVAISFITSLAVYLLIQFRTRSFALAEEHKLQQAKDELLSLASHQLRTPATGVKQYIGMVLDGFAGRVPRQQHELLEQAYKSNERQLQIINEFLYVAKLGSGSLTTTMHRFDMVPVVRDVVNEMKAEIKERDHKITLKTPKSLRLVADEHSVRMIIENLLSNAIKYTKPGGKLTVEVKRGSQKAMVSVKDTGIGIDKKDMQLLFKQFSRIPNELSTEVSGSGIGLYLAQQLAAHNGGLITVESEPDVGTSFTLHLPIKTVRNITKTKEK